MTSSSCVVKTTRKARGFAPFCPQLQFQAVGQEHRRSGRVIHDLLSVLKCLELRIIIQDSKDPGIRFQEVGQAKRLAVISKFSKGPSSTKKQARGPNSSKTLPTSTPRYPGCQNWECTPDGLWQELHTCHLGRILQPGQREKESNVCRTDPASAPDPSSTCLASCVTETYRASFPAVRWEGFLEHSGWGSGPARRQSSLLPDPRQVPPGPHSAGSSPGRAQGEGSRSPAHPDAPRLKHGVPAHTFGPRDPAPAAGSTTPTLVKSKSGNRRTSRHRAPALRKGGATAQPAPWRSARVVSAGTAGAPRVLARVSRPRTRSCEPLLPTPPRLPVCVALIGEFGWRRALTGKGNWRLRWARRRDSWVFSAPDPEEDSCSSEVKVGISFTPRAAASPPVAPLVPATLLLRSRMSIVRGLWTRHVQKWG